MALNGERWNHRIADDRVVRQPAVDRVHHDRSFADAGGNTLHGPGAHVPDHEYARDASGIRRTDRHAIVVVAREDETPVVECDATIEPIRVRDGPDHQKEVRNRMLELFAAAFLPSDG